MCPLEAAGEPCTPVEVAAIAAPATVVKTLRRFIADGDWFIANSPTSQIRPEFGRRLVKNILYKSGIVFDVCFKNNQLVS